METLSVIFANIGYTIVWCTALLCVGLAFAGCVIPVIPGHIFIIVSALLLNLFLPEFSIAWYDWCLLGGLCVAGSLADNVCSMWGAKKFGSTKAGMAGCFIGAVVLPLALIPVPLGSLIGMVVGPFLGALIAELIAIRRQMQITRVEFQQAYQSGKGALFGLLISVIVKLVIAMLMTALLAYLVSLHLLA